MHAIFTKIIILSSAILDYPLMETMDYERCSDEGVDTGWYRNDIRSDCVLAWPQYDTENPKTGPIIRVGGRDIYLISSGTENSTNAEGEEFWTYYSDDRTIELNLYSRHLVHDSCADPDMGERCCGQLYSTDVQLTTPTGTVSTKIWQWDGM